MSVQYSTAVRDAQNEAFEATLGAAPKLQLRTGAAPANCAAASTGTLLVEMTLPTDWMSASASGVKALLGTWTGAGVAAGSAAHFRLFNNAGSVCGMQGTVTATGGGGDMTLDNISIAVAQTVNVTAFTITRGNA